MKWLAFKWSDTLRVQCSVTGGAGDRNTIPTSGGWLFDLCTTQTYQTGMFDQQPTRMWRLDLTVYFKLCTRKNFNGHLRGQHLDLHVTYEDLPFSLRTKVLNTKIISAEFMEGFQCAILVLDSLNKALINDNFQVITRYQERCELFVRLHEVRDSITDITGY